MIEVEELPYDLAWNYKTHWNNHRKGTACWCGPILSSGFLIHRNYEWRDDKWHALKEPQ